MTSRLLFRRKKGSLNAAAFARWPFQCNDFGHLAAKGRKRKESESISWSRLVWPQKSRFFSSFAKAGNCRIKRNRRFFLLR